MKIMQEIAVSDPSARTCSERRVVDPPKGGRERQLLYFVWRKMVARCHVETDASFCRYGARGITVCDRWRASFDDFLADMFASYARGLQLDRVNNDGPYCKENCRWATRLENLANTRNVKLVTYRGETHPLREWCRRLGVGHSTVGRRLARGMSVEDALRGASLTSALDLTPAGGR